MDHNKAYVMLDILAHNIAMKRYYDFWPQVSIYKPR